MYVLHVLNSILNVIYTLYVPHVVKLILHSTPNVTYSLHVLHVLNSICIKCDLNTLYVPHVLYSILNAANTICTPCIKQHTKCDICTIGTPSVTAYITHRFDLPHWLSINTSLLFRPVIFHNVYSGNPELWNDCHSHIQVVQAFSFCVQTPWNIINYYVENH